MSTKSEFLFIFFFLVYTLLIVELYQCNLRAYLVQVDYEKSANTLDDVVQQQRDMYLPIGSALLALFARSPIKIQQDIYDKTVQRNTLFTYGPFGSYPEDVLRIMDSQGAVIISSADMERYRMQEDSTSVNKVAWIHMYFVEAILCQRKKILGATEDRNESNIYSTSEHYCASERTMALL